MVLVLKLNNKRWDMKSKRERDIKYVVWTYILYLSENSFFIEFQK